MKTNLVYQFHPMKVRTERGYQQVLTILIKVYTIQGISSFSSVTSSSIHRLSDLALCIDLTLNRHVCTLQNIQREVNEILEFPAKGIVFSSPRT